MKGAFTAVVVVAPIVACVQSRAAYVEPSWGDAPAPIATEVTEVFMERMDCPDQTCVYTRTTLKRDGRAERSYRTGKKADSSFVGSMEPVAFSRLAAGLIEAGLFRHRDGGGASHEEFQDHDVLVSAATLCRRKVQLLTGKFVNNPTALLVDSAAARINWARCCTAIGTGRPPRRGRAS